jgi:3-hydroxyisobutyrate dehydrogenase-like beta-hydroxyacid dehydrogenase
MNKISRIAMLGFGEAGQALASDLLRHDGVTLSAWDTKFMQSGSESSIAARASMNRLGTCAADAVRGAELVISAVTAAQTLEAARAAVAGIGAGTYFLDINSASPGQKQQAAKTIEARGGRYVEAAMMSPVHPRRCASPILLGGPHAAAFIGLAQGLGFSSVSVFSNVFGAASAAKLCRSILVKGLEALITESMMTARYYHVDETVLASLGDFLPGPEWPKLAAYMVSRSIEHGARRAEEMREAAQTVSEAGLDPLMSVACAGRQEWAPQFEPALEHSALAPLLDAMRKQLVAPRRGGVHDH